MKLSLPKLSLICLVLSALLFSACEKEGEAEDVASRKSFTAKIDGRKWEGQGSYVIAFGNTPQLFMLSSQNDTSSFHLEFRATGKGSHTTMENGYYFSLSRQATFKVMSGTVTLQEVNQNETASGTFSFHAKDLESGKVVTITDGKFESVKGLGHW